MNKKAKNLLQNDLPISFYNVKNSERNFNRKRDVIVGWNSRDCPPFECGSVSRCHGGKIEDLQLPVKTRLQVKEKRREVGAQKVSCSGWHMLTSFLRVYLSRARTSDVISRTDDAVDRCAELGLKPSTGNHVTSQRVEPFPITVSTHLPPVLTLGVVVVLVVSGFLVISISISKKKNISLWDLRYWRFERKLKILQWKRKAQKLTCTQIQ